MLEGDGAQLAARLVSVMKGLIPQLKFYPVEEWRNLFALAMGQGAPRLIGEKLLPEIRRLLIEWGHPWAPVALAEWLRLCAVQNEYGRRKASRLEQVRSFVDTLPPAWQGLPPPQLLALFTGSLVLKKTIQSPATVGTYVGEAAAALGIAKKAKPVSETLAGLNRLWLHTPKRAIPVPPEVAYQKASKMTDHGMALATVWISNGARQGCIEHLIFEPWTSDVRAEGNSTVLVLRLERRKGLHTWMGPRAELRLRGPGNHIRGVLRLLMQVKQASLDRKEGLFRELVEWRMANGFQAHGIRRGTSQWMSLAGVPEKTIAAVMGHAEEVRRHAVTQLYTEGQSWADRQELAKAQPPGGWLRLRTPGP